MDETLKNNIRSILYFRRIEESSIQKDENILALMDADLDYKLRSHLYADEHLPAANDETLRIKEEHSKELKTKRNVINNTASKQNNTVKLKNVSNMKSTNIFISYSHDDDEKWINLLKKHLKVLIKEGISIDYWDDTRIKTGDKWKEEIEKAINASKVAILLVSTNFLASDFVREKEIPQFLQNAKKRGCEIMPLIISPCRFEKTTEISCFQSVNSPKKTLQESTDAECDRILLKLMDDIESKI